MFFSAAASTGSRVSDDKVLERNMGAVRALRRCASDSLLCHTPADITGAPAEDSAAAAVAEAATEAGAVLTVQRCGAHAAHVCLCAPCPLDGLRLVCHWAPGDGGQRLTALGHR